MAYCNLGVSSWTIASFVLRIPAQPDQCRRLTIVGRVLFDECPASINRPAVLSCNLMDIAYPAHDEKGHCHEPDSPEIVPGNWPVGFVQETLEANEESIRSCINEITVPNATPYLEPGHQELLRQEQQWAKNYLIVFPNAP